METCHWSVCRAWCRSGFQALAKQKSQDIISTHCTIRRQALIMKTVLDVLNSVLGDVIRAVNLIKGNSLHSRLLTELCKESDSEFETLLLQSHVRWPSKENVLQRVLYCANKYSNF